MAHERSDFALLVAEVAGYLLKKYKGGRKEKSDIAVQTLKALMAN